MLTNQEIKDQYIENHTEAVKKMIKKGQVQAFIQVIATNPDIDKPIMMHIDVPASSNHDKEMFVKHIIPMLKEEIKDHNYKVVMVSFTSEAWIRKSNKNEKVDDYTKLPISDEVVMITFSDENGDEFIVYDIQREELEVDDKGNLIEKYEFDEDGEPIKNIELILNEELTITDKSKTKETSGRFSDLYNKLK